MIRNEEQVETAVPSYIYIGVYGGRYRKLSRTGLTMGRRLQIESDTGVFGTPDPVNCTCKKRVQTRERGLEKESNKFDGDEEEEHDGCR